MHAISKVARAARLTLTTAALMIHPCWAQEADAKPDKEKVAEQHLLLGNATRGSGKSQVAVNPLNPNQIAVAAMSVLHQNNGKSNIMKSSSNGLRERPLPNSRFHAKGGLPGL